MSKPSSEIHPNDIAIPNAWDAPPEISSSRLANMLLEAAARLVDLPAAEFDAVIHEILDQLATYLQMEHVGLSFMQGSERHLGVERRYVAGSNPLLSADELAVPFPWYSAQLRSGKSIILPNVPDDLPPEAETERLYAIAQGLKCSLVIPLRIGDQLIGSLYFNSTTHAYRWPDVDLHAVTIFARVLAGAAQRKQSDEVLRRHEEQLSLAIDAAGVGIWSWDLLHPERSYASDNMSKIHGISPCPREESLNIYLASLHPEDRAAMEQLAMRCMMGEVADFTVEHRLLWPNGSLHWVEARGYVVRDATGQATRLTGVMQEITSRKEVQAQVEQQRQELLRQARMMEQTERIGQIGGWEWEIATNAVYWTPETYTIFGLSPALFTPTFTTSLSFYTPASATILQNAVRRATEFGESFDLKLQALTAQGTTIWVRVSAQIEVVAGRVARLYGSVQDITLRTEIEVQLRDAQKMEAIGQLAGGIAHDFNNLLTAINGMSELALIYLNRIPISRERDRVRNYISEIHRAGGRAADLTRQLLAFSRKQVLQPKVLDLRVVLMGAQELLNQILGENITLSMMVPSQLGLVLADPSQIEQVIVNLVINAREAMPNGGTVTIKLMNMTIDEVAARRQLRLQPGHYVVLEVQDSGHGMTPEVQARLFDPFFTTKAVGEGAGLGLATVYGIVKQSGGMIEVDSQISVGSTFRIFLPQAHNGQQDSHPSASQGSTNQGTNPGTNHVRGGTETILVVEEDEWTIQRFRSALEAKGYRLLEATSGRGAIALCQSYVGRIHLLVASETIGDMMGATLANQALLLRPELRVLLLLESGEVIGTSPVGHSSLHKPFRTDALTAKVRSVLDAPLNTSTPL